MASDTPSFPFSKEDFAAFDRARQARDANGRNWSSAFGDTDRLVLPLETETESVKNLQERLEAVLTRYNQGPRDGVTVIIDPADDGKVVRSKNGQALRRDKKLDSLANFLRTMNDPEAWLVAHDWEMERDKRRRAGQNEKALDTPAGQRHVAFDEIEHDRPISCDRIYPDSLRAVISRDPMDIARMSTGRRWTSCMAKGRENFRFVPDEIAAGSLVAYLVHKDDTAADYPLMRVLLKPFRNDAGESILVPNLIYPKGVADNTATEAALRQVVNTFVRQQNQGKTGTFTMDPNIYTDGQETSVTLGFQQSTADKIAEGMMGAVQGKVIEYVTEIEAAHRNGNQAAARQYTQQLKRLYSDDENARITHYLRSLRSVNVGQQLPQPETIREALRHPELLHTLKSHEILANLYILGGEAWNRYMQKQHATLNSLYLGNGMIGVAGAEALAKNTTLHSLVSCRNEMGNAGAEALAKNSTLTSLDLNSNQIGDAGAGALAKNTALTTLDLSRNEIGDTGAADLAKNTTLASLNLWDNQIQDAGASDLAKNTTLTSLNLANNRVGDSGAAHLAKNKTLKSLSLEYNNISDDGSAHLANNSTLTSLNLALNEIGADGASALSKNRSLNSLNLRHNRIGDAGAAALAKNSTLTLLVLNTNQIGDTGAAALAKNNTLASLYLNTNQIGDAGAAALAKNSTLTSLDLSTNQIWAAGAAALGKNTALTSLNLCDNQIQDAGASALAENATLISVNLANNGIGDPGAEALANNTTITSLVLDENKIGDKGATHLARNAKLTSLNLRNNLIEDTGAAALAMNGSLVSLDLQSNHIDETGKRSLVNGLRKNKNLLEYEGPGREQLTENMASNRNEALRLINRLIENQEPRLNTAERREIDDRANAIKHLLDRSKDFTQDQKTNALGQLRDIVSAVHTQKWRDRVDPAPQDRHRVRC